MQEREQKDLLVVCLPQKLHLFIVVPLGDLKRFLENFPLETHLLLYMALLVYKPFGFVKN